MIVPRLSGVCENPVGQGLDIHRVGEAGSLQRYCTVPPGQSLQHKQGRYHTLLRQDNGLTQLGTGTHLITLYITVYFLY